MKRPSESTSSSRVIAGASIVAVLVSGAISCLTAVWTTQQRDVADRSRELLQERRQALLDALTVIDWVYANTPFRGTSKTPPRTWDVQLARDAMNRMYVYCRDPQRTIAVFVYAIGAHNPEIEQPQDLSPARVNAFRREVARELDFSLSDLDDTHAWLAGLNGAE